MNKFKIKNKLKARNKQIAKSPNRSDVITEETERQDVELSNLVETENVLTPPEEHKEKDDFDEIQSSTNSTNTFSLDEDFEENVESNFIDVSKLPDFFQSICKKFEGKDIPVALVSAITVMSSIIPNIFGIYENKKVYPNFYFYLVGKAGSGKSSMDFTKQLVSKIDVNRTSIQPYTERKEGSLLHLLEEKENDYSGSIHIPANSSAAGFTELLEAKGGVGLIFETEGDTLANIFKKEYGDYSDMFRKAFHHETISQYRKTEGKLMKISEPKLSVLISSTPKQFERIVPDVENGLFSRFSFMNLDSDDTFHDVFSEKHNNREDVIEELSFKSADLYYSLKNIETPVQIKLTHNQQQEFLTFFRKCKSVMINFVDQDLDATVHRIGLTCFRITQTLTVSRYIDKKITEKILFCCDDDFNTAMSMSNLFLVASKQMFEMIKKSTNNDIYDSRKKLFNELPVTVFTTAEAKVIGGRYKISERNVDRFLKTECFKKVGHGKWQKIEEI